MKIAVTCAGDNTDSPMESRFGRAARFFFIASDGEPGYFTTNRQNREAVQGAGIQAAQQILGENADVLITGHCGPKAFRVLKEGGVRVFQSDSPCSVEEGLRRFSDNQLKELQNPDVEGHWG